MRPRPLLGPPAERHRGRHIQNACPNLAASRHRGPSMTPTWKLGQECFIVRDGNGQALAYVYFEDERGRRSAAHLLTRDEARCIAANIAKLPRLVT